MFGFRFPYRYRNTYPRGQPSPGAMATAFEAFQLYPREAVQGPGISVRWSWAPFQPPQKYVILAVPTNPVAGAGIPAGQIFGAQLLDPNAPPYPAYESI